MLCLAKIIPTPQSYRKERVQLLDSFIFMTSAFRIVLCVCVPRSLQGIGDSVFTFSLCCFTMHTGEMGMPVY